MPHSFRSFHDAHLPGLLAFFRHRGRARDAEDLAQDTFLRFARWAKESLDGDWNFVGARGPKDLRKMLYTAARSQCVDVHRREGARVPTVALQESDRDQEAPPDDEDDRLSWECILVCEKACTPRQWQVFLLHQAFRLPHEEIAEILGSTTDATHHLMMRAKKSILNCLKHSRSSQEV